MQHRTERVDYLNPKEPPTIFRQIILDPDKKCVFTIAGQGPIHNPVYVVHEGRVIGPSEMFASGQDHPRGVTPSHRRIQTHDSHFGRAIFWFLYGQIICIEGECARILLEYPDEITSELLKISANADPPIIEGDFEEIS
ncbi:MAG: hypothetical protein AAB557_05895 [Patescibacteria group bacterium]